MSYLEILLSFSLLSNLYPIWKIFHRKELNIFDVFIVVSSIFYLIIPLRDLIVNHQFPEIESHTNTGYTLLVFYLITVLIDYFWGVTMGKHINDPCNLSAYIRRFDYYIKKQKGNRFNWLCIICALIYFIPLTSYGSMTEDTSEINNQLQYGLNMPFWMTALMLFLWNTYPILLIIAYRNFQMKVLPIACITLLTIDLLLGSKSNIYYNIAALSIYFYSINVNKISPKQVLFIGTVGLILLFSIFRMSQTFRQVKTFAVVNLPNHSFLDVIELTFTMDSSTKELMNEKLEYYAERRSMNVFNALDWAVQGSFRGNGELTYIIFKYIKPQRVRNDGNLMGDKMAGEGADIGESLLSWFVCDWGPLIGIFICYLTLFLLIWLDKVYFTYCSKLFKTPIFNLFCFSIVLGLVVNIEYNPATCIKNYYSTYVYQVLSIFAFTKIGFNPINSTRKK